MNWKTLRKLCLAAAALVWATFATAAEPVAKAPAKRAYRNVGYVFQRGTDISRLDVTKVTHINAQPSRQGSCIGTKYGGHQWCRQVL